MGDIIIHFLFNRSILLNEPLSPDFFNNILFSTFQTKKYKEDCFYRQKNAPVSLSIQRDENVKIKLTFRGTTLLHPLRMPLDAKTSLLCYGRTRLPLHLNRSRQPLRGEFCKEFPMPRTKRHLSVRRMLLHTIPHHCVYYCDEFYHNAPCLSRAFC